MFNNLKRKPGAGRVDRHAKTIIAVTLAAILLGSACLSTLVNASTLTATSSNNSKLKFVVTYTWIPDYTASTSRLAITATKASCDSDYGFSATVKITAGTKSSGNETYTLRNGSCSKSKSYTWDFTRGTSDSNITFKVEVSSNYGNPSKYTTLTIKGLASYKVTCKPNGGSGSDWSGSAYSGSTITLPGAITRTGYTFGGWNTNNAGTGTNYAAGTSKNAETWGDLTLYAKWTEKTATLTYANGGHGTAPSAETMRYTQATTAKAGINGGEGWAFAGWKNSGTGVIIQPGETVKAANVEPVATVLTAQWVKPQYSITYEGMSGATFGTNHPETGTYDQEIRIDNPSMPGYKFRGWEITGMDSCTHTIGTETTTATSITTKEQYFTNLRGDSGTVTFTALWQSLETGYRVMFAVGEPD